jgi:hypothetical protein
MGRHTLQSLLLQLEEIATKAMWYSNPKKLLLWRRRLAGPSRCLYRGQRQPRRMGLHFPSQNLWLTRQRICLS